MLWGGNFAAIKYMLDELAPVDVMFVRSAGAAFFFTIVLLLTRRPFIKLRRPDLIRLVAIGVLGVTILNVAVAIGMNMLSAALASLIVTSNPIHTAIISRILIGEPLTRRKVAGIVLAFSGFLIVLLYGSTGRAEFSITQLQGVLILAMAPFAWAFYTVLSKPLLNSYPSMHIAGYTSIVGSIGFLPLPLIRADMSSRIGELSGRGWGAVLFATLFGFVLAYILWYRGLQVLTPSQTSVYIYLVPVFGLLSAWLFLGETPTAYLLLGGATILSGVILTNSARPAPVTRPAIEPPVASGPARMGERGEKSTL